ncbi:MAG TPA: hypothetical protein VFU15_10825 [Bacteroidia bacterium]|nr:hypothetical protein [Bacteroidia bacterium]
MKKIIPVFLLFACLEGYAQDQSQHIADSLRKADSIANAVAQQNVKPPVLPAPVINTMGVEKFEMPPNGTPGATSGLTANKIFPGDFIGIKMDTNGCRLAEQNLDTFRLWINGLCYTKIKPAFLDRNKSTLIFRLDYDTSASSPWKLFYALPNYWTFRHQVVMNAGTLTKEFRSAGKGPQPPNADLFTSAPWMLITGYSIFGALLFVVFFFGKGIIKDVGLYAQNGVKVTYKKNEPTDIATGVINVRDLPYSLSRFQFLFWLIIIFFGITHIWAITDTLTTPTGTVLLLLGISGGTFYISRLIDANPSDAAPAPGANTDPATAEAKLSSDLVQKFVDNKQKSKGFLFDMLNDGKGISLHRLQLVVFTIFLGTFFVWQVLYNLGLPEFSATMMTLMGISSGTYAGMKTTEK